MPDLVPVEEQLASISRSFLPYDSGRTSRLKPDAEKEAAARLGLRIGKQKAAYIYNVNLSSIYRWIDDYGLRPTPRKEARPITFTSWRRAA